MSIVYNEATRDDIDELVRLRIAYMRDDFGEVSVAQREAMETQLPDYFERKLGDELLVYTARDEDRIVATVYLHVIEIPANNLLLKGLYGEVLSVYTEPEYRGKGICTKLMSMLIEGGKKRGLERIDLSATKHGYPVYKRLGFEDRGNRYTDMRLKL